MRTFLAEGRFIIPGFVVTGDAPRRVLIRAAGPALGPFGLTGLSDPVLTLYSNRGVAAVAENDDWKAAEVQSIADKAGAFPFWTFCG
ncbi:MAG: hypothetical protein ACREIA_14110 [Opitutaceae bacterium]